ncbi:hypothetical protein BVRB_3g061920 [Beta vulgaris subsp. vulgaris]|nr:hypothetical protein BVRB_3g061920 [Beta vulgaris subsp. vulgaris]
MDFDPRVTSDGYGWHCNFHFGYGHDVIEDAKNEKSCVQVLQCLIAKADAEIHDLEDELAILQCQLKWAESDEQRNPYEVCCATFKQKIDLLTTSIMNFRNKNILTEHGMDTTVEVQRPAERIYDIITALIKKDFAAPGEQVEDLSNEMNLLVNSGSMGTDLRQREMTSESSAESKELLRDFGRQFKPADTVSEESCSETAKYVIRDSIEGRELGKTDVEVTGKIDAYEFTSEGKTGFLTSLQHGESEECMTGTKNSGSGLSSLSAKAQVVVKVEEADNDMSIQHVADDFLCKTQDQESGDLVRDHQEVKEFQFRTIDDIHIKYGRKKSSLSSTLKPQGQKVQRKNLTGGRQINRKMLKPQGKIGKRQFPSNADKSSGSDTPISVVEDGVCPFPDKIWPTKLGDIAEGHQPRLLGSKKRELQGASIENASIHSKEMSGSKEDDVHAMGSLALKSRNELVMCLESPLTEGGIDSVHDSSPANLHIAESKRTIVEKIETKESPAYDFESLRLKLSEDPQCLNKLKVPEIKDILKHKKVPKLSKLKKDKMIEELTKLLKET